MLLLVSLTLRRGVLPRTMPPPDFIPHTPLSHLPILSSNKLPSRNDVDKLFKAISTGAIPYHGSGIFVSARHIIMHATVSAISCRAFVPDTDDSSFAPVVINLE